MLYHAMPCYAMLRHAGPCYAMLCHAMSRYAMLYGTLYHAMPCYAMLRHVRPRYAMPRHAMLRYAMPRHAIGLFGCPPDPPNAIRCLPMSPFLLIHLRYAGDIHVLSMGSTVPKEQCRKRVRFSWSWFRDHPSVGSYRICVLVLFLPNILEKNTKIWLRFLNCLPNLNQISSSLLSGCVFCGMPILESTSESTIKRSESLVTSQSNSGSL